MERRLVTDGRSFGEADFTDKVVEMTETSEEARRIRRRLPDIPEIAGAVSRGELASVVDPLVLHLGIHSGTHNSLDHITGGRMAFNVITYTRHSD